MNKQEILKEILLKVKYSWEDAPFYLEYFDQLESKNPSDIMMAKSKIPRLIEDFSSIIFNIAFAKAFFGKTWAKEIASLVISNDRFLWLKDYMNRKEKTWWRKLFS